MDASVAVKGALCDEQEPLAGAARTIRPHLAARFGLRAPRLLAWEVGDVVHAKAPDAFAADTPGRQGVVELILRDFSLDDPDPDAVRRTGALAEKEKLTFYDAAYLELAERTDGLLITQDANLLEAGRSLLSTDRCMDTADALHRIQDGIL